jgi:mannose-6-phosphate isomerase-like protein (cupin superfamily)
MKSSRQEKEETSRSRERASSGTARRPRAAVAGVLVGAAAAAAVGFGVVQASATPPAGIVGGPIVARGPVTQDVVIGTPQTTRVTRTVRVRVGRRVVRRRVSFQVATVRRLMSCGAAAPCDIAFQQLTIAPGGHTGWHTHPGPTFVSVAQGEGTLYHGISGCPAHKYGTGTSFFQPTTEVHNFRNEGSTSLVVYALYYLPSGTPNTAIRTDQAQPWSCPSIP